MNYRPFHALLKDLFRINMLYSLFFFSSSAASFNFFSSSSRVIGFPFFFHSSQTVAGSLTRKGFSFSFFFSTPELLDFIFISKFYIKETKFSVFVIQSYEKKPGFGTEAYAEVVSQAFRKSRHFVNPASPFFIDGCKFIKSHISQLLPSYRIQLSEIKLRFGEFIHKIVIKTSREIRLVKVSCAVGLKKHGLLPC
jgi:hypothetical protein